MLNSDTIEKYVEEIEKEKEAEAEKKKQKKWCSYTLLHLNYILIDVSYEINLWPTGNKKKIKS